MSFAVSIPSTSPFWATGKFLTPNVRMSACVRSIGSSGAHQAILCRGVAKSAHLSSSPSHPFSWSLTNKSLAVTTPATVPSLSCVNADVKRCSISSLIASRTGRVSSISGAVLKPRSIIKSRTLKSASDARLREGGARLKWRARSAARRIVHPFPCFYDGFRAARALRKGVDPGGARP